MSIPVLGNVDWKWFLIGLLFSIFILPFLMRLFSRLT